MIRKKYFNDAVIGNGNMVASFSKEGELLRIFYPNTDYRQFLDFMLTGVKVNDSNMIYLSNDVNNTYNQYYTDGTNILNTEIYNSYFKLKVLQTDFVTANKNVLIKRYEFENKNNIDLDTSFTIYSKLVTDINNQVSGLCENNVLKQYMHDYTCSIFSDSEISSYQINSTEVNIKTGVIAGKDYVGMSPDSSIQYDLGTIKPGEKKTLNIYIYIKDNSQKNLDKEIEEIQKCDVKKELSSTKKYWNKYLEEHSTLEIEKLEKISNLKKIYERTILLFPLLINSKTGGISAGIEIDEEKTNCGRYSYCWPRDAIFMTNAMDTLNMTKEADKFYNVFCKNTQSKSGMWEQRFYTDGVLAPCWGYQIDETASVIYGVYNHYLNTKNDTFLKNNLKMCEKAIEFLMKYLEETLNISVPSEDVVKNEILDEKSKSHNSEKEALKPSYDLWEENEGIHTYSIASIYASFEIMQKIHIILIPLYEKNRLKQEKIRKQNVVLEKLIIKLKKYITQNCYDENLKTYVRNAKDKKMDISLLGLVTPFNVFSPADKKIKNTIERINLTIRTYTGGYLRYEGDTYAGGNPWVIANLWMAEYHIKDKNYKEAIKCLDFVAKTCSELGFLGEQVDNKSMKPAWVVGLGWSHAMFINVLNKLL